jgi:hypothetical protein
VLAGDRLVDPHELHADDFEATLFEAANHFAREAALDGIGFGEHK